MASETKGFSWGFTLGNEYRPDYTDSDAVAKIKNLNDRKCFDSIGFQNCSIHSMLGKWEFSQAFG